ncbi:MAG: hypothetical protein ACK4VV_12075 [Pseudomonas sp.]
MSLVTLVKITLMVLVVTTFILSWKTYRAGRLASAQKPVRVLASRPAIRELTREEREALPDPLEVPWLLRTVVPVQDGKVYALHGVLRLHNHNVKDPTGWHYIIEDVVVGNVEVILPYDAERHLNLWANRAEVVLAGDFAVVVRLNDRFELVAAKRRHDLWAKGLPGVIEEPIGFKWVTAGGSPMFPSERQAFIDQYNGQADEPPNAVRRLSQREETRAERLERAGVGIRFKSAFFYLLAFTCLAFAIGAANPAIQVIMLFVGLALFILACGFFRSSLDRRKPVMVNRVEGVLFLPDNPTESNQPSNQAILGGRLAFTVPPHWMNRFRRLNGERVEVEVRVPDFTAVAVGSRLSLQAEIAKQPLVFWGSHFFHLLLALGLLFWIDSISPDFSRDVTWAYHQLNQNPELAYGPVKETLTTTGIRLLWFVLVSVMIAIHLPMLVWKMLAKRRREGRLREADGVRRG